MAWYKMRREGSGGGVQPVGDATDSDVKAGKTYMNANGASTGTMTDRGAVSQTLNTTTTSYTVPEGYHNGSGTVSITTETKTITAGTSASTTSATSGKVISSVTVNPTPSQTKSASPSTSAQTITPDSGKLLSSVSISAISPARGGGTSAYATGINSTGPYVYFPYGWYSAESASSPYQYVYMTAAQAVNACPKQEKTSTPTTRSATAATVTPDSGKLLSKVTVNTNSVPNSNSGTKTITSSDTNWYTGNVDMGATNTFRYVNAVNVYNKGRADINLSTTNTGGAANVAKTIGINAGVNYNWTFPLNASYQYNVAVFCAPRIITGGGFSELLNMNTTGGTVATIYQPTHYQDEQYYEYAMWVVKGATSVTVVLPKNYSSRYEAFISIAVLPK